MTSYIAKRASDPILLTVLPHEDLTRDTETPMLWSTFRYAEYPNTGLRLLVRVKTDSRHYVKGWSAYAHKIEAYRVDQYTDAEGVLWAKLGEQLPDMIANEGSIETSGYFAGFRA